MKLTVTTNLEEAMSGLAARLQAAAGGGMLRAVAVTLLPVVKDRIHTQGLSADGTPIGVYNPKYLKRRQRKPYNRTADPKKINSLTRQMENDFSVIATPDATGLGFKNEVNYIKARFTEKSSGKTIYGLTVDEKQIANQAAQAYLADALR